MSMAGLIGYDSYVGFALASVIAVITSIAFGLHFEKHFGGVSIDLISAMPISVILVVYFVRAYALNVPKTYQTSHSLNSVQIV